MESIHLIRLKKRVSFPLFKDRRRLWKQCQRWLWRTASRGTITTTRTPVVAKDASRDNSPPQTARAECSDFLIQSFSVIVAMDTVTKYLCEIITEVKQWRFYIVKLLVNMTFPYSDNFVWSQQCHNNWEGLYRVVRQDLTPKLLSDRVFINRSISSSISSIKD